MFPAEFLRGHPVFEQVQKAVNSLVCDGLAMAQLDQVICVAAHLPKFAMGVCRMDF